MRSTLMTLSLVISLTSITCSLSEAFLPGELIGTRKFPFCQTINAPQQGSRQAFGERHLQNNVFSGKAASPITSSLNEIAGGHDSMAACDEGCIALEKPNMSMSGQVSRLTHELNFEPEMARVCMDNGLVDHLLRLKDEGFVISEDDPLLLMVVDINNAESRAYANSGNYGLPALHPGARPWPGGIVPAEVVPGVASLPPGALGKFIASLPGVTDKSGGNNCLFHLPDLGVLNDVRKMVSSKRQFVMYGPSHAELLQGPPVQEHECPVKFYTMTRLDGTPKLYDVYYLY